MVHERTIFSHDILRNIIQRPQNPAKKFPHIVGDILGIMQFHQILIPILRINFPTVNLSVGKPYPPPKKDRISGIIISREDP